MHQFIKQLLCIFSEEDDFEITLCSFWEFVDLCELLDLHKQATMGSLQPLPILPLQDESSYIELYQQQLFVERINKKTKIIFEEIGSQGSIYAIFISLQEIINMKTVIEKIILTYFGKFINGIHKDNLSVDLFGGNFQLENISLNQQFFDSLNTPFQLTYSTIGKLNLQAPISKLSSTPVECTLDNIYAVFEFRKDEKSKQEMPFEKQLQQKKEVVQKYVREMFQDYLKKLREKDDKKEDGMMAKLGKKIIDNLQLKIINLHIRFQQNKNNQKYAWGVTLEQISFMTTDQDWKPTFVDRLAENGKNQKLLKKMSLKNLSIYWQSGSQQKNQQFISQLKSSNQKAAKMSQMVHESKHSIISLTSEVKLIINQTQNLQEPLYQLSVELAPIVFELEKVQVSQMIDFTQKNISENEQILKNLSLKKKKSKKQLQPEQKIKLQGTCEQYVELVLQNYEQEKEKGKKVQESQELLPMLRTLVNKVQDQQLLVWALKPIRRKVKQAREKQLKKKKKGWFGGQYQLTEQETKALSNFVEEVTQTSEKQRPPQCLFFSLKILIQGGKFVFISNKNLPEEERLQFEIGFIDIFLVKSSNQSILDFVVGVQSICLNLFLPIYGSDQKLKMNILKNMESQEQEFFDPGQSNKFISIRFCKKIQTQGKPLIKTDIIGEVKQIAVTYKKVFMKKFKSFFTFNNFNQSMKNQTMKKWQQMKQKNQQKNNQAQQENAVIKMFNIQFKITSPLFVCPLTEKGGWCFNLGQLEVQSKRDEEKQLYPIKVSSAFFRYYPDLTKCFIKMNEKELNNNNIFCLVKDMNFMVTYMTHMYIKKEHTSIVLPNFQVNFTQKQYKNLISLKDIFKTDDADSNFIQILKKQRQEVEKNKVYEGPIQKKSGQLDKWRSFYGILSGQYIYLYGSQKQLKCLQKVPIKNLRLEYSQGTKTISLVHQSGVIQLTGAEFQNNVNEWKERISGQMKQFMTIYEIVEQMAEKQQNQIPRKRKDSVSQIYKKQKSLTFKVQKIGFNYKDQKDKDLMAFQLFGLVFEQHEQNKISNKSINIEKLQSIDHIYEYKNKNLQTLIATKQIGLKFQRNKNEFQKKLDIQLNISDIYINWKPDVLVILMKLIYSFLSKEVKHRVDDGQQKTREQLFQQVLSDPKFSFSMKEYERNSQGKQVKQKRINFVQKNKRLKQIIRLNLNIKNIQVLMIHRQSHLIMFKLIGKNIDNEVAMGQNQKFVSGSIDSLMLYEMTGYPRQNYTQNDEIVPYLIIKPREQNSKEPIVSYKWSSYESFVLPNSQRVNSFLYLTINPIQCHYFQQITFRLIDYILIQVILLLNQPQMIVANENLLEQLKKRNNFSEKEVKQQSQLIVKILFSEYEEVIRRIIDPYFMDMYFQLKNPSVIMKPQKNSNFYHRADIKNIIFVSNDIKNSKRFNNCQCPEAKQFIYEQTYDIMCNQCHFFSVKELQGVDSKDIKKKEELVFDSVDVHLTINKLIMQDQINLIYPQLNKYDRSFQTTTSMSKLVIKKLTRQQYLSINKLVNFNMVYDDNKDQCFIHNFKITKLLSPKPICYELVIPQIQLTGIEGNLDSDFNLFTMMMEGFRLTYNRSEDLNSSFRIQLVKANLIGYQYQFDDTNYRKNISQIMMEETSSKKCKKIQLMSFKPKKQKYCTDITVKMKTSGEKIIEMNIETIQAFVKLHLLQLVFQWCLLEDWVFPTVSIYANDITFHLTIHNMSAWLKQTLESNSVADPRAFVLLGVFCYKFHRKANFSQQHIEQLLKSNQLTCNQVNKMPEISYMTILLNTEVFHCLASGNVTTKRQVVEKITFNMIQKRYFKVANEKTSKIKTLANRKLNFDKGLFKFSFTDVFLMQDILAQIGKDREYIIKLRQLTNPELNLARIILEFSHQTQLSTLQDLDIQIESFSLYLINNCRQAFIPTLRLHINNATINKSNTFKKDLIKTTFDTSAYYFNPEIFRWEPILQKVDVSASKLVYRQQFQNIFASFETGKPVLLNISKQLMSAVRDTLSEWNKKNPNQFEHKKKILQQNDEFMNISGKKNRNANERIQLVSQYVIRNQIGYPITIYSHDRKLQHNIPHLQQVDYEYELEKYDQENDIEILIGIEIMHDKYRFKRITHISLGRNLNFAIMPQISERTKDQTLKILPMNSIIKFVTETKDSKRHLIIKTSKWIEDYLNNKLEIILLPFDHKDTIVLLHKPHQGKQVSLYKNFNEFELIKGKGKDKDKQIMKNQQPKFRYMGSKGVLKIMGRAMVYNYTPIPLQVNGLFLMPDEFVTISSSLTIQNQRYKDCKGVRVHYDEKNEIYYIYCEGYIIDYAGLYYEIDQGKEFSYQIQKNGLRFNIYLLSDSSAQVKVRLQKKFKSSNNLKCSALIKPAVGNQIFQLQNYHNSLCEYKTYGYLSQYTGNQYKDFKKIIQVTPLYVLSNTTNYSIKVCQLQSQQSCLLAPGERMPFFWQNKSKPRQIKIAALKDNSMWGYSGPLSITHNTHSFVVRNNSQTSDYRILSLQVQNTNTINFVHIIDCHPKKGNNIMICNMVDGIIMRVYQSCIFKKDYQMLNPHQYVFIIRPKQQLPFGYQIPLQTHEIVIQILFDINNPKYHQSRCTPIKLFDIENNLFQKKVDFLTKQNKKKSLLLRLNFQGNVKKLQLMKIQKEDNQIREGEFICKIPRMLISLVGYQDQIRKQIINILLIGIQLNYQKTNRVTEYLFTLRSFQIGNCLKTAPIFPVIFESNVLQTANQKANFFIQFMIVKDNLNSKLINYIGVSVNRFIISVTSEEIQCLQENITEISKVWNDQKKGMNINNMRQYELFQAPNQQLNSSLYFIQAEIFPLKLNVTFKHVNNWGGRFLKTFASIDNCNLNVAGKKISHFSSRNISQFLGHLKNHYQQGITKLLLPMIGNLAILGSPISLAQRIGSGFKDLIELPSEGFNVSPLEGGKGLAKGAGSLMKNTFEGAFNSVESVTGSVGNGLSSLAFDQQFSRQRQKIQNDRSSHIGQGLANGAKSIANGFAKGITGLITSPVEGAQENGIGGFFLGGIKGLTGLVVKPVSGIFDATTKTFQGIKNTPSYLQKKTEKGEKAKRKRNPRVFYTINRQFRSYDEDISMSAKIIGQRQEQKFENLSWYGIYHLKSEPTSKQKRNPLLIITYEYLIIHNLADNSIIKYYKCEDIFDSIPESLNKVKIIVFDSRKKKFGHILFELRLHSAHKLTSQIKAICNGYRPVYGFNYVVVDYRQQDFEKEMGQKKEEKR